MILHQKTQSFTVPSGVGSYATEILYISEDGSEPGTTQDYLGIEKLVVIVTDFVTDSSVELDLLDEGGTWRTAVATFNAKGVYEPIALLGMRGARVRVKSDGTSGTGRVMALIRS